MPDVTSTPAPASIVIDPDKLSFLEWLLQEDRAHQERVRVHREYYDGKHATQLTERQRVYLEVKAGQEFCANYCPIPIDALSERLVVNGFGADDIQSKLFQEWWASNRMDALQGRVYTAAIRDGDTFVLVEWNNDRGMVEYTHELALVDGVGMRVYYDPEKRKSIALASKHWVIDRGPSMGKARRMNVYYPDRIEKYISYDDSDRGVWLKYDDGRGWPLWWTRTGTEQGEPLGVPVVHFKNKDQGYNTGQSELEDVEPLQNALNKSIIDLLAAADTTAFRLYYMLGDDPANLSIGPGAWIWSPKSPNSPDGGVAVGHIPGENLDYFIRLKDSIAMEIARVTRTPLSYFQISGDRPAADTLMQEESGLVAKAAKCCIDFGNAWEDLMAISRKLWNTFGDATVIPGYRELDETVLISCQWRNLQTRNEKELFKTLKTEREALKTPLEILWRKAGYTPEEIEGMKSSPEYTAMLAGMEMAVALNGQMNEASNG